MADYEKFYKDGFENEKQYGGCAQCVLKTLYENGVNISPDVIKAATGLAAGVARGGNACGALTGGVMAISGLCGRTVDRMDDAETNVACIKLCRKLTERFMQEYGSCNCRDIQYHIMGGSYRMYDDEDRARFLANGGHDDKCTNVVGKASAWVAEILDEAGMLNK